METLKNITKVLLSAIFAGFAISIGCVAFLQVGGVIGAILFAFGLLTVVHYGVKLYTGTAGFVNGVFTLDSVDLLIVLLGNVIGCALMAYGIYNSDYDFTDKITKIAEMRSSLPMVGVFVRAVLCGVIMTAAVKFWRTDRYISLIVFGVPVFICSGFLHSIADAFYYSYYFIENNSICIGCLKVWGMTVFGNYVGCNVWRILSIIK